MQEIMEQAGLRRERVQLTLQLDLKKDLQEHEVICPSCNGSGMKVTDNIYGLKGIETPGGGLFHFKNQSLSFCQACYNGVQKKCEFCQKLLGRHLRCNCDQAEREYRREPERQAKERWETVRKITLDEAKEKYAMLYIEESEQYISPKEIEQYFADLKEFNPEAKLPVRIYGTDISSLSMDAASVVEDNACELHEEAAEQISEEKYQELQNFLDKWCEDVRSDTTTYYADFSVGVIV